MKITIPYNYIIFVLFALALIILTNYMFVNNNQRANLRKQAENALSYTQIDIASDLNELKSTIGGISETVRLMIMRGDSFDEVQKYITDMNQYMLFDKKLLSNGISIYGVFDAFNGAYVDGTGWVPGEDYIPTERPWYKVAIDANDGIGITEPYLDAGLNVIAITFARRIFDNAGKPLGVVCLDVKIDRIRKHAVNIQLDKNGYGLLLNSKLEVIAHPDTMQLGKVLDETQSGVSVLASELKQGMDISERELINYKGEKTVVFFRKIENGWFIGSITPKDKYYHNIKNMMQFIISLCIALILVFGSVLFRIYNTDKRAKITLDKMPLCMDFRDKNLNIIDCNDGAISFFELLNKREYIDKFNELSPKYQPDGQLSEEKLTELSNRAFSEGQARFEWAHQKLDGTLIPCEVVFTRVEYNGDFVLISYTWDLRGLNNYDYSKG